MRARDLVIEVAEGDGDPTTVVRERFDAFRKTHPCAPVVARGEDNGCAQSAHSCGVPATLLVVAVMLVLSFAIRRRLAR